MSKTPTSDDAVNFEAVWQARQVLRPVVRLTPLLEDPALSARADGRVFIKAESLQLQGSFKIRGAYNRLSHILPEDRDKGVVAWSSGNHAQGVALAARLTGINAAIVMPADAPKVKIDNTRSLGAEIVFYDRRTESREAIARSMVAERGATLVPSYDDPLIIAGQGTVGLEIFEQMAALGIVPDQLLVCCGGGGLVAGCATAVKAFDPRIQVYSVEPSEFDDTARSLVAGTQVGNATGAASICDALLAPEPGELTFPINQRLLSGGLSVTDAEVRNAMHYAFAQFGLVVEPGGAVALAAALSGKVDLKGLATVVVLSGSNVDPEAFGAILSEAAVDLS